MSTKTLFPLTQIASWVLIQKGTRQSLASLVLDAVLAQVKVAVNVMNTISLNISMPLHTGSHLADVSVWINVAKAVAALDVSRAIDKDGKAIDPVVEMTNGFVMCVLHLSLSIPLVA